MAGTTRGARSAFGEHNRRPERPGWAKWLPLLLLLLLVAAFIIALIAFTDDDSKSSSKKSSSSSSSQSATKQSSSSSSSGGGGGTLTSGGTSLLPAKDLSMYVGRKATGKGVTVQKVVEQQGFWVGTSKTDRVYVEFGAKAGVAEKGAAFKPKVGDKVNVTGEVRPAPKQPGRTLHITVPDEKIVKRQGGFINAKTAEKA